MVQSLGIGDAAPQFTLKAHDGASWTLQDLLKDGPCVLFFYPKNETRGCTAEACAFRDTHQDFADLGVRVVGISDDSEASHEAFKQHHKLPYLLLSDTGGAVRQAYGIKTKLGFIPGRVTFVIDQSGSVQHVYDALMSPQKHVTEALETARRLKAA